MLEILISCAITAGLLFLPVAPWRVQKIEGASVASTITLCWQYPCETKKSQREARFFLEAVVPADGVDIPEGCTLVSLKPRKAEQ